MRRKNLEIFEIQGPGIKKFSQRFGKRDIFLSFGKRDIFLPFPIA
jgi:hypothetical protein